MVLCSFPSCSFNFSRSFVVLLLQISRSRPTSFQRNLGKYPCRHRGNHQLSWIWCHAPPPIASDVADVCPGTPSFPFPLSCCFLSDYSSYPYQFCSSCRQEAESRRGHRSPTREFFNGQPLFHILTVVWTDNSHIYPLQAST